MNTALEETAGFSVVIIEDEPEVAEIIALNLEMQGATVYHGADGLTGCRLIGEHDPDVIVLDLLLPDMDGREICRIIRNHEDQSISSTPIIMLTALGEAVQREQGIALGANDYVAKPFSVKEVTMRVRNLALEHQRKAGQKRKIEELEQRYAELKDAEAVLVHEVRNKIVAITGLGASLEKRADEMSVTEIKKQARHIKQAGRYLESMARKLAELRRVDESASRAGPARTELTGLLGKVVSLNKHQAEERGIKLELDFGRIDLAPVAVPGEEAQLCISNLVENAVKHCPIMSTVSVTLEQAVGGWEVAVEDNGPGIPETMRQRVFERFVRVHGGEDSAPPGSGLGLYMVKNIIERRGGTVTLEEGAEGGARFTLFMPATAERQC